MTASDAPFQFLQEGNVSILELHPDLNKVQWGEIDAIGNQVLTSMEARQQPNVIVDLSHLNYMGSAMVALIVRVWKATTAKKGKMTVVCPHPGVQEVIHLASLDKHWAMVQTVEEARGSLGLSKGKASNTNPVDDAARWKTIAVSTLCVLSLVLLGVVVYALNRQPAPIQEAPDQIIEEVSPSDSPANLPAIPPGDTDSAPLDSEPSVEEPRKEPATQEPETDSQP